MVSVKRGISIFLLFWSVGLIANSKIDSLERKLQSYPDEDAVKVSLLNQLGYEYWIVNPIQSIIYGQKAIALSEAINDSLGLAFANRVTGVAHWARGSYDDGLKYLSKSLELYRSLSESVGEANSLMNIGLIYSDRLDFDRALSFYFEALQLFDANGEFGRSATTYTKIASVLIEQTQFTEAQDYLDSAWSIHIRSGFKYGQMEVYNRLGLVSFGQGRDVEAIDYLNRSLQLSSEIQDQEGTAKTLSDLADIYISVGQLEEAEEALNEGLSVAYQIGSYKWLRKIYQNLQLIYRKRGDLEKAIDYYDKYLLARDSILNEQTLNNITRMESQLAIAEQQRQLEASSAEIIILEQQAKIQKSRILALILLLLLVVVLAVWIAKARLEKSKKREVESRREAQKISEELEIKNKELVSYAVNFVQKNQLFEELIESIQETKKVAGSSLNKDLVNMERIVKKHLKVDRDWEDFKMRFETIHSGFFDKLLARHGSLTTNELRLSVLVKMNFSIPEISEMLGISTESVKTARYRLKKKLKLPQDQNLNDFLGEIA